MYFRNVPSQQRKQLRDLFWYVAVVAWLKCFTSDRPAEVSLEFLNALDSNSIEDGGKWEKEWIPSKTSLHGQSTISQNHCTPAATHMAGVDKSA